MVKKKKSTVKKFILIGQALFFMLILASCTKKYNYNKNGLFGLENQLKMDMSPSEIRVNQNQYSVEEDGEYLIQYKDVMFLEKYKGKLNVNFKRDDSSKIDVLELTDIGYYDGLEQEIADDITSILGEAVHKENFNDKRFNSHFWMWEYDDQYIVLCYDETEAINITWGTINTSERKLLQERKKEIADDVELNDAYQKIMERLSYNDKSIEEAINVYSLTDYEINETSIIFKEPSSLFGKDGVFKYACYNPYNEDVDFIGKIEYISFCWEEDTECEKDVEKLEKIFGPYSEVDSFGEYCWYNTPYWITYFPKKYSNLAHILFTVKNNEYYLLDPFFDYDDGNEEIMPYVDCDISVLHLEEKEWSLNGESLTDISDDRKELCWSMAKDAVLKNLKAPSTATFPSNINSVDVKFKRMGDWYQVKSFVDAENSFGAKLRVDFTVELTINSNQVTVDKCELDE